MSLFRIDRSIVHFSQAPAPGKPEEKKAGPAKETAADNPAPKAEAPAPAREPAPAPAEPAPPPSALPAVSRQCGEMLQKARAEAEAVVAKAREEAQAIRAEAQEQGLAHGVELARAQAASQLAALRAQDVRGVQSAVQQLMDSRADMYAQLEQSTLVLSLLIAEKILAHEVESDKSVFTRMVAHAVGQVKAADHIIVRLSSEDFAIYYPDGRLDVDTGDASVRLQLMEDSGLPRGSILVETSNEVIDASVRTQLATIREAFTRSLT